jgi:hypothetical protein
MVDSKSLRAAAKECGINLTTAFNWRHRFFKLTDSLMSKQLEGIAEMDETQFKYSEKGNRQLTADKPRKRGSDKAPKVKIVIGIDRSGHIVDDVVGHFTLAQLKDMSCLALQQLRQTQPNRRRKGDRNWLEFMRN